MEGGGGGGIKRVGCSLAVISQQCLLHQRHQSRAKGKVGPRLEWRVDGVSEVNVLGGLMDEKSGVCVCAFFDSIQRGGLCDHEEKYLKMMMD